MEGRLIMPVITLALLVTLGTLWLPATQETGDLYPPMQLVPCTTDEDCAEKNPHVDY